MSKVKSSNFFFLFFLLLLEHITYKCCVLHSPLVTKAAEAIRLTLVSFSVVRASNYLKVSLFIAFGIK